jgi:molybdate transport system permease protein
MIAGNIPGRTRTLPLAVYSTVAAGDMETSYGYVAIIMTISFIAVALINYCTIREGLPYKRGHKKNGP